MTRRTRVYVAGPLSTGADYYHTCANVKNALAVGDALMALGYAAYIPHLTHYWHLHFNHTWEEWMDQDKAWVLAADALIRMPGESRGADCEVQWAKEAGIPVFDSVKEFHEVWGGGKSICSVERAKRKPQPQTEIMQYRPVHYWVDEQS
jgi:hypothetical protein